MSKMYEVRGCHECPECGEIESDGFYCDHDDNYGAFIAKYRKDIQGTFHKSCPLKDYPKINPITGMTYVEGEIKARLEVERAMKK